MLLLDCLRFLLHCILCTRKQVENFWELSVLKLSVFFILDFEQTFYSARLLVSNLNYPDFYHPFLVCFYNFVLHGTPIFIIFNF